MRFGSVAAAERRAALLDVFGTHWWLWIGEAVAFVAVLLFAAGVVPAWVLAVATVLLIRPLARAIMRLVRSVIEGTP